MVSRTHRRAAPLVAAAFATLALAAAPDRAAAQECGVWLPVPAAGDSVLGVAWGNGTFVGVGTTGAHTSADGAAWSAWPITLDGDALVRVAWSGSLWVAVGDAGRVYSSPDGTVWTPRSSQTTRDLAGVAWGGGTWVAVGELETVLTSPDGITWTQVRSAPSGYLTSVAWTGSGFVAVGQGGRLLTSPSGSSWSPSTVAGEDWLTDATWAGSQLVVVSYDGTVLAGPAAGPLAPVAETGRQLRRILWTGGRFIAGGNDTALLASPDAITWETEVVDGDPPSGGITGLAWSGTAAVAVSSPAGVFRTHCGAWADFAFAPEAPAIGEEINFFATRAQGIGRARWDFGEVGCDGGPVTRDLVCFSAPCTFATRYTFASAGTKTVRLLGWTGEFDGEGRRVYVLLRTRTVTVAATGSCSTCAEPGAPGTPSPANLAIVANGDVTLRWSAPVLGTPPFTFDVEVDGGTACLGTAALECAVSGLLESSEHHLWKVTAHNACGEKASPTWKLLVCSAPAAPTASFAWTPSGPLPSWPAQQQPFPGQEVTLVDQSSQAPGDWAWSGLTDGGLVSEPAPQVTWWAEGSFPVGLRAANCLGWSAETLATVVVHPDARPRRWAFDFGTATSPLAAGFVRVAGGTGYSPARGHGWTAGAPAARDRQQGDDLARDFHFTVNATFAVDVPARAYDVTVWLGDSGYAHDEMALYLEGQLADVVSTQAGEVARRVFRVPVADGQLTVRLRDLGGLDPNAVVNAIEIAAADRLSLDFGTASSPVAAGYRRLSDGARFVAPHWCGWLDGRVASRDRGAGGDLLRDFAMTQDGTLGCALGRGVWDVAVTLGDELAAHDQVAVVLEDVHVATVSTAARQHAVSRHRVRVADGALTARFDDLGGKDVNAVIDALEATRVGPFDFGTAQSPVQSGHTAVSQATRYAAIPGFGWLAGTVGSRDRGAGGDLLRDLAVTADATFAVDVPNGAYDVSVVMGDATNAHDRMAVVLEGAEAAVVSTARGQYFSRTFRAVVADGQLTVRVADLGGADASAVINALSIAPAP